MELIAFRLSGVRHCGHLVIGVGRLYVVNGDVHGVKHTDCTIDIKLFILHKANGEEVGVDETVLIPIVHQTNILPHVVRGRCIHYGAIQVDKGAAEKAAIKSSGKAIAHIAGSRCAQQQSTHGAFLFKHGKNLFQLIIGLGHIQIEFVQPILPNHQTKKWILLRSGDTVNAPNYAVISP